MWDRTVWSLPNNFAILLTLSQSYPRLEVGLFNIMRNAIGIYHAPDAWVPIYIWFTSMLDKNDKRNYVYFYTLEPKANSKNGKYTTKESICRQQHMSERERRENQKDLVEQNIIYDSKFAVHPVYKTLLWFKDPRYRDFKKAYFNQQKFDATRSTPFHQDIGPPVGSTCGMEDHAPSC